MWISNPLAEIGSFFFASYTGKFHELQLCRQRNQHFQRKIRLSREAIHTVFKTSTQCFLSAQTSHHKHILHVYLAVGETQADRTIALAVFEYGSIQI